MKKINNTFLDRSSLVGEWLLDGNANDTAGTNNGTATNVTWASASRGYVEEVGSFNGSSSQITFGDIFNLADYTDLTIAMYINIDNFSTRDTICGNYAGGQGGWDLNKNTDNKIYFQTYNTSGSTQTSIVSNEALVAGQYYLILFGREGSDIFLQIHGGVEVSGAATIFNNTTSVFYIGTHPQVYGPCAMDAGLIKGYDKKISQAEITTLYLEGLRKFGPTNNTTTIPVSGLVASYDYDDITLDTSGNGNDGTATSVTTQKVGQQNVGVYNGSSSGIDATITTGANFSISLSFKATNISLTARLFARGTFGNDLAIQVFQSKVRGLIGQDGSGLVIGTQSATLISGKTYRYILSYDGANLKQYLDGVLITNDATTATLGTGAILSSIGYDTNENKEYFGGQIGLPRIYNRVLTQAEIDALNHEAKTKLSFPNYSLRNLEVGKVLEISKSQSGGVYIDQTGNGNNGTATSVVDASLGLNNVMSFNGTSSKILLNSGLPSSLSSYSIVFSVKDDVSLNCLTSLYKRSDGARIITCEDVGGGVISAGHRNGAGSLQRFSVGDISTTSYTRIGWTWDGLNIRTYNNGVLQSTNSVTSIEAISSTNYIIGACDNSPLVAIGNYSKCSISNYKFIPNETRSDIEMQQDYYSNKII